MWIEVCLFGVSLLWLDLRDSFVCRNQLTTVAGRPAGLTVFVYSSLHWSIAPTHAVLTHNYSDNFGCYVVGFVGLFVRMIWQKFQLDLMKLGPEIITELWAIPPLERYRREAKFSVRNSTQGDVATTYTISMRATGWYNSFDAKAIFWRDCSWK